MSNLLKHSQKTYGRDFKSHLFEQYKMYVDSVEKVSDRRQNANNYFITINTVLIALIGTALEGDLIQISSWVKPLIAILGLVICIIFGFLIGSYKQLNTGKFKVLHEIESVLPLNLYAYEWEVLGSGKDCKKYFPFSHLEQVIPWIFSIFYIVMFFVFV